MGGCSSVGPNSLSAWGYSFISIGATSTRLLASEAPFLVVIHKSAGLHPGVDDHRATELEPALLECGRQRLRLRRPGERLSAVANDRRTVDEGPGEVGEVLAGVAHREVSARVADRGVDLGP